MEMSPLHIAVIKILIRHRGYENRIKRADLLDQVNRRLEIEWLRTYHKAGAYICSSTAGGYWMAATEKELRKFLQQDRDRAVKLFFRTSQQARSAGLELAGNVRLVEV